MNVSEYIFNYLYSKGIDTVFILVGGGSMYLNDAVAKSKMKVICCHHEQACAYAAVGYSKYTNKPCVVLITSGCGGTNCITGLLDAYQDSVPVIFISGQVNNEDINYNSNECFGIQSVNINPIIKSFQCFVDLKDVEKIKKPIWLDVPLNIQKEDI